MPKGYERHEGDEELKGLDIGPIAQELEAYNEQFGIGAILGRAIAGAVAGEEGEPDETDAAGDQNVFLRRIDDRFGITLAKTGLELQPVKGPGALYKEGGTVDSSALRFNLADAVRFRAYLSALEPESITESQVQGLTQVASLLRQQLLQEYEGTQDSRTAELMKGLGDMVANYQRLDPQGDKGLADAVRELPIIGKAYRGNYLSQYLEIHKQGLFSKIGERKFGPSDWHTDMTDGNYRGRWTKALQALRELKMNPSAMELHRDLLSNLILCAEHARRELEEEAQKAPLMNAGKRQILDEVLAQLSESVN